MIKQNEIKVLLMANVQGGMADGHFELLIYTKTIIGVVVVVIVW